MSRRLFIYIFIACLLSYTATAVSAFASDPQIYYDRGVKLAVPELGTEFKLRTEVATYYSYTNINQRRGTYSYNSNSFALQRANLIAAGNFADMRFALIIRFFYQFT